MTFEVFKRSRMAFSRSPAVRLAHNRIALTVSAMRAFGHNSVPVLIEIEEHSELFRVRITRSDDGQYALRAGANKNGGHYAYIACSDLYGHLGKPNCKIETSTCTSGEIVFSVPRARAGADR